MGPGNQKFKFLEAITETEAAALGVNLSDKIRHYIYRTIQERSSVKEARKKDLFTLRNRIEELADTPEEEVASAIRQLIEDRVVVQMFRLDNDPADGSLVMVCCFVARPNEQIDPIPAIYQELIQQSVEAVEARVDGIPATTEEQILEDFQFDLRKGSPPLPGELIYTVLDLSSPVDIAKFTILPSLELIKNTIHLIKTELMEKKLILELEHAGILPLRDEEILLRFHTACTFMIDRVLPLYRDDELRKELSRIDLEEADYFSDEFASPAARFMVKRAGAIRRSALAKKSADRESWFPGSLAISTVLAIECELDRKYKEFWQNDLDRNMDEFKEKIIRADSSWHERLRIVDPHDMAALPPDVKERLMEDDDLFHGTWERPGGKVHLFIPSHPHLLEKFLVRLAKSPPQEKWKIFAIQDILERHEHLLPELRTRKNLEEARFRLINNGCLAYLPWYFRLLLLLFPGLFAAKALRIVDERVTGEQKALKRKNEQLESEKKAGEEKERALRREKLLRSAIGRIITRQLDDFYIDSEEIPLVGEVHRALGAMDSALFLETIRKMNFQLVSIGSDDPLVDRILLYPLNYEWRGKYIYIFRTLEKIFENEGPGGETTMEQAERARALQKHLERVDTTSIPETPAEEIDPYRKFKKLLKDSKGHYT